jgi:hypothetical protein
LGGGGGGVAGEMIKDQALLSSLNSCPHPLSYSKVPVQISTDSSSDLSPSSLVYGDHREVRILGFFLQSSELSPPHPLTRRRVCPSTFVTGGTHSLAGEGVRGSQFGRGDSHCGTLYELCDEDGGWLKSGVKGLVRGGGVLCRF